jgi:hypothetical protein
MEPLLLPMIKKQSDVSMVEKRNGGKSIFLYSEITEAILKYHMRPLSLVLEFYKVPGCKCAACVAGVIKPVRMRLSDYSEVFPFPQPQICRVPENESAGGTGDFHYAAFHDVYGKGETSERDLPLCKGSSSDSRKFVTNFDLLVMTAHCSLCNKPRGVYVSDKKFLDSGRLEAEELLEETIFSCGSSLVFDHDADDKGGNVLFVVDTNNSLGCISPIELSFFRSKAFKALNRRMCGNCGVSDDTLVTPEDAHLYHFKSDLCRGCLAKGALHVHSSKKKIVRKAVVPAVTAMVSASGVGGAVGAGTAARVRVDGASGATGQGTVDAAQGVDLAGAVKDKRPITASKFTSPAVPRALMFFSPEAQAGKDVPVVGGAKPTTYAGVSASALDHEKDPFSTAPVAADCDEELGSPLH